MKCPIVKGAGELLISYGEAHWVSLLHNRHPINMLDYLMVFDNGKERKQH